jgi:hypothetical protein
MNLFPMVLTLASGRHVLLCEIGIEKDGTYCVTAPYFPPHEAMVGKAILCLDGREKSHLEWRQKCAVNGDPAPHRLRLTQFHDGFLQFVGHGLVSRQNPDGASQGIGTHTFALRDPIRGPAFILWMSAVEKLKTLDDFPEGAICFREADLADGQPRDAIVIEGQYFPPFCRQFLKRAPDGGSTISVAHPSGVIGELRVLVRKETGEPAGFPGVRLFGGPSPVPGLASGYIMIGATGNRRKNESGQRVSDSLYCVSPPDLDVQGFLQTFA